jgi:acetoin utilization deacetylase AcuC-like enzyme
MDQYGVPVVWSPTTREHDPRHEIWVGVATDGTEVAARVDAILDSARVAGHRIVEATVHSDEVLLEVHDPALLDFLATAAQRWREGPYAELVGQDRVVPYLFPTPAMTGDLPSRPAVAVHADAGRFAYDTMTLVGPGTWAAARAAVDCALSAADLVAAGEPVAYARCRPPGHHATRAGFGGSCYLNNAAVAAESLHTQGFDRVGIIDIDAHQGNGTAAIFYDRDDVLYGSVHVDPAAGWFPHIVGYADETGSGAGVGATKNMPLPEGTADGRWLEAVQSLADWVVAAGCSALVVSLGVDAAKDDPESPLLVTVDGYRRAGAALGGTDLPAVVVQEGGYHLPTLGSLVAAYLDGHAGWSGPDSGNSS